MTAIDHAIYYQVQYLETGKDWRPYGEAQRTLKDGRKRYLDFVVSYNDPSYAIAVRLVSVRDLRVYEVLEYKDIV